MFFFDTRTVANSLYRDVLQLRDISNQINILAQHEIKPSIDPRKLHQISFTKIKKDPFYREQYLLNFCKKTNRRIQSLWDWCKRTNDKLSTSWRAKLPYTWFCRTLRELSYAKADILSRVNKMLDRSYDFNLINRDWYINVKKLCNYLDLSELMFYSEL